MSETYFKSILIADINAHTAKYQTFVPGLNVITSKDNHVGKSSLLKSLYYALGAEVDFDSVWDRSSKLYIITACVDGKDYKVARLGRNFAVFQDDKIIALTDNVTKGLSPVLEQIFNFAVYLPNKNTKRVELSPPAFSFLPYYIDQDKGWSGLYESFAQITQYKKDDRLKSLYYHLNIYTKATVEAMAERDRLLDKLSELDTEGKRILTILDALSKEVKQLPPADTFVELEKHLDIPQKRIENLVRELGNTRNEIQRLETALEAHRHQLDIIEQFQKRNIHMATGDATSSNVCPRCGYVFDKEIYELVLANYSKLNEDYLDEQIHLIIASIEKDLEDAKKKYVSTMHTLHTEEQAFKAEQDEFDTYIRQRGLRNTINRYTTQLGENKATIAGINTQIKAIEKDLRDLPTKKEVEEKYIERVRLNIMALDAWNPSYDGNIKLLKPIKAQGTLENKIILAQFVGLFQTMEHFSSSAMRFPFVVDSPRAKEASVNSSHGILKMISEIDMLPQIILATIDYSDFQNEIKTPATVIELKEEQKLLCSEDYLQHATYIEGVVELLKSIKP